MGFIHSEEDSEAMVQNLFLFLKLNYFFISIEVHVNERSRDSLDLSEAHLWRNLWKDQPGVLQLWYEEIL
jgi:hypothetical protein